MSLGLLGQAARLGSYRHLELQCFSLLGERAASCRSPDVARFCYEAAAAHGYRALLFEQRLPVSFGLPAPHELTRPASASLQSAVAAALGGPEESLVAGTNEVLYSSMLSAYKAHAKHCVAVSDGPIIRALARASADLGQRRLEADVLPRAGGLSDAWQALAQAITAFGGLFGPIG